MRRLMRCVVVVSLFGFLSASGAAGLDLRNDPRWIALMKEAPLPAGELARRGPARPSQNKSCTAQANCGSYTLNCSNPGPESCEGTHQNCAAGERGFVRCGSTVTQCGECTEPANPCPTYPIMGCTYYWVPQAYCCYTTDPGCSPICY